MEKCTSSMAEAIQHHQEKRDWPRAIQEMEKLFAINRDPHIRVRIGDARRKLNRHSDAIREYILAGDLFADEGFMAKALAQYSLVLRLDSGNEYARLKRDLVSQRAAEWKRKPDTMEYRLPQPA